jgi:DNA-directed RNA polymerase specialized sigma24 family protein
VGGYGYREIGERLQMTLRTVERQVRSCALASRFAERDTGARAA